MSRFNVQGTLGAAVADAATFTVAYPNGTSKGTFAQATQHQMVLAGRALRPFVDFIVTHGAANITVTNRSGASWPSGSAYIVSLDERGARGVTDELGNKRVNRATSVQVVEVNLGAPITADADGVCAAQAVTAASATGALLNGAVGATLDVPRNVVAAWTGAAVCTVRGVDEYGNALVEASANGTAFTGKKAFKSITSVKFSADVTAATVGTGDVLGLPVYVAGAAECLKELQDAAAAAAGTFVAGDTTKPSATTGDVRGTYDPNAACDGAKVFRLWIGLTDPTFRGAAQYAG